MFKKNKNIDESINDDINENINDNIDTEEKKKKFFFKLKKMKNINNEEITSKKSFFSFKRNKKEYEEEYEENIKDKSIEEITNKNLTNKDIFKQRIIVFSSLGVLSIIVFCVLISVLITFKVEDVDIYSKKPFEQQNEVTNNEQKKEDYKTSKIDVKDESYFNEIKKIRNFHYNSNKNITNDLVNKLNEEKEKEEQAQKEEQDQTNQQNTNNPQSENSNNLTNIKSPIDSSIKTIIDKSKDVLEVSLANSKNKFGGTELLDIPLTKLDKLNQALAKKGTTYEKSKFYKLDPEIYNTYLGEYDLDNFVVATEGVLLGDIIYIGNDVQGLKDTDNTFWFGYNLYIK